MLGYNLDNLKEDVSWMVNALKLGDRQHQDQEGT